MEPLFTSPITMLQHWVDTDAERIYLRQPIDGHYVNYSWQQVQQQVQKLAGALRQLGLQKGDHIALLSKNCAEWFICDLALMYGGYVSVPIYPTANVSTIRYVLEHSGAKAIFIGKLDNWQDQQSGIGDKILSIAMPYPTMETHHHWHDLLELNPPLLDVKAPTAEQIMTILYTSGATGKPKGVMQTFASYDWTCRAVVRDLKTGVQDRLISYLPLAHITERVAIEGSSFYSGSSVAFVENLDSFVTDVQRAKPTLFFSIPRLWSLFQQNIIAKIGHKKLELLLKLPLISTLVKNKIHQGLGLEHCKTLGCGSAPIPPSLIHWYHKIGLNISEAWGMTENSAYSIINHPFEPTGIGSVGRAVAGSEVSCSPNGELLVKSPGLMLGYYRDPQLTESCFDDDGYFHTGDLCTIDDSGRVTITGRIKDNFKTAKGKYVAPVPIELDLAKNPYIELICLIGVGLAHPIALVQLADNDALPDRQTLKNSLKTTLDQLNLTLESHETVAAIIIVNQTWQIDNDVLTPTLKIKRHVLEKRYSQCAAKLGNGEIYWEDEL